MVRTKGRKQKNRTRRLRNKTKRRCHTCNSILKLFKGGNGEESDPTISTEGSENVPQSTSSNPIPDTNNNELTSNSGMESSVNVPQSTSPIQTPDTNLSEGTIDSSIEDSEFTPSSIPIQNTQNTNDNSEKENNISSNEYVETETENNQQQPSLEIEPQPTPVIPNYKYKNEVTEGDTSVPDKLTITSEDLLDITNDDVLGTKSADGTYINDGILYNKEENDGKTIKKVTIMDIPEVLVETTPTDNLLVNQATTLLKSLSYLLTSVKDTIPDYVEVQLDDKKFIISKSSPYIVM